MFDLLFDKNPRRCDGLSRRDFLRVGAVGSLGLTLSAALKAEATPGDSGRRDRKSVV
jgi:hypothetical protein